MDAVYANVNTAALVLGYPVLFVLVLLILLGGTHIFRAMAKIFREVRYDNRKAHRAEVELDNIKASWVLDLDSESRYPVHHDQHDTDIIPGVPNQRHPTEELPELSILRRND